MLEFIRERAQGWLAWAIVIAIIIPFALWGVNQYFVGGGDNAVAEVNGAPISQAQFQNAYFNQRQRLQEILGENFRPEMFPEEQMKQQVLQELVRQELLVQAARDAGFRVADAQLAAVIRDVEAFQVNGQFSPEQYRDVLRRQGMQPGFFETRVLRDVLSQQFIRGLAGTSFATPEQIDRYLQLEQQKRDIGYLVVPASRFIDEISVADEEIEAYYNEQPERFMVPEQVKVAYLDLDLNALADGIEVDDETVRARYESQKQNYRTTEERQARHILIAVGDDAGEEAEQAARQKAEGLLEQIRGGASFAELAKEHSDDPGSAKQGGDLGFFGPGAMVPAFDKAVFSLAAGEVTGPVRTPFGYHIIKLEAVRGGETKPFEEVRDEVARTIKRERAEERFYEMAEQLANLTYEHPNTLEVAAEQLGLTIQETEPFPRRGATQGIAANPKFAEAAFAEDVLVAGNNSEVIELGTDRLAVLRVREHNPQRKRPLEQVREQIAGMIKRQKATQMAENRAQALAEQVAEGADPKALAKEVGGEWTRVESVGREAAEPRRAIVDAAFGMPRPSGEQPETLRVALTGGDQAVVAVYGVEPGNVEEATAEQREGAEAALRQAASEAALSGVISALRARAEIDIRK